MLDIHTLHNVLTSPAAETTEPGRHLGEIHRLSILAYDSLSPQPDSVLVRLIPDTALRVVIS